MIQYPNNCIILCLKAFDVFFPYDVLYYSTYIHTYMQTFSPISTYDWLCYARFINLILRLHHDYISLLAWCWEKFYIINQHEGGIFWDVEKLHIWTRQSIVFNCNKKMRAKNISIVFWAVKLLSNIDFQTQVKFGIYYKHIC